MCGSVQSLLYFIPHTKGYGEISYFLYSSATTGVTF